MRPTLTKQFAGNFVGGQWIDISGDAIRSINPADPSQVIWHGSPNLAHVDQAVLAAREALKSWSATRIDERTEALRRWQKVTTKHADTLAGLVTDEMGKIMPESTFEAKALAGKVDITLDEVSIDRVREYEIEVSSSRAGFCRYKPHGVMVVIGPFNFPAHLANGHFVPAMLMGNTIIFKPSEKTPAVGQMLAEMMEEAEIPPGVFNLVQGGPDIANRLVTHDDIDGILFTGSWPVGRKILEANLDRPGRLIALEMGGNNPSIVLDDANFKQAVIENVRAAFATTGQRCTCTRRIIVQSGIAEKFIPAFCKISSMLLVGPGRSPLDEPVFMGPLVTEEAADRVIAFQQELHRQGGRVLVEATRPDRPGFFVTPGVVEVDRFTTEHDCEVFGPLAQISIVDSLDEAIQQANASDYGLAASIFTTNNGSYETFFREARAGCINHNCGTAGASSKLPFGGTGKSGNHRPAGAFSVDYCAFPVANMVETAGDIDVPGGIYWDDAWGK